MEIKYCTELLLFIAFTVHWATCCYSRMFATDGVKKWWLDKIRRVISFIVIEARKRAQPVPLNHKLWPMNWTSMEVRRRSGGRTEQKQRKTVLITEMVEASSGESYTNYLLFVSYVWEQKWIQHYFESSASILITSAGYILYDWEKTVVVLKPKPEETQRGGLYEPKRVLLWHMSLRNTETAWMQKNIRWQEDCLFGQRLV